MLRGYCDFNRSYRGRNTESSQQEGSRGLKIDSHRTAAGAQLFDLKPQIHFFEHPFMVDEDGDDGRGPTRKIINKDMNWQQICLNS